MEIKLVRQIDELEDKVFAEAYKVLEKSSRYESCLLINSTISLVDTIMSYGVVFSNNSLVFTITDPKRIFVVSEHNDKYSIAMDDPKHSFNYEHLTESDALKKLIILQKRQAI